MYSGITFFSNSCVNHKGLTGIAHTRPLCLRIMYDPHCHVQIRVLIHIDMAVAAAGFNHRHRTVFHDAAYQPCASTRNQYIDRLPQPHHLCRAFPGGVLHDLNRVRVIARIADRRA